MKKILLILPLFVLMYCTDTNQRREQTFYAQFKNESNSTLKITGYGNNNTPVYEDSLEPNATSIRCKDVIETFLGMGCKSDSFVFKFNNDKGYICSTRFTNKLQLCFKDDKSPFGNNSAFRNLGNNIYEFPITQEDYNNAFELPK